MTSNRRDFIRTASITAGAVGLAGCAKVATSPAAPELSSPPECPDAPDAESPSDKLSVTVAGYQYDRVRPLIEGKVPIEGCEVTFQPGQIGDLNSHAFFGPQTNAITEIGLHPFILAKANDNFGDYSLLPIFPLRTFRHKSIFIRTDRGISKPEDLKGKRIATPGYASSSLVWIRGTLQDEYGISPSDIEWVVSSKTSDSASGKASKYESVLPEGIKITHGPEGVDESTMLERGDVDALFHAVEPRAYKEGNPIVGRLFADYRQTERAYFKKTGIFPIMHAVAVRKDLIDAHPELLSAVFRAYSQAKQATFGKLSELGWAMVSLPWFGQEFEETQALMGKNFWPYGIEPNRKTLEHFVRYSHEQGLAKRLLSVEELFHPATHQFLEGS